MSSAVQVDVHVTATTTQLPQSSLVHDTTTRSVLVIPKSPSTCSHLNRHVTHPPTPSSSPIHLFILIIISRCAEDGSWCMTTLGRRMVVVPLKS